MSVRNRHVFDDLPFLAADEPFCRCPSSRVRMQDAFSCSTIL
jgi:hypothetical protein